MPDQALRADLNVALPVDPDPPTAPRAAPRGRIGRTALDRELLAIAAVEYARVLASREPNREGKILCPFHEDSKPSLQLYPDGGFFCFGSSCRARGQHLRLRRSHVVIRPISGHAVAGAAVHRGS